MDVKKKIWPKVLIVVGVVAVALAVVGIAFGDTLTNSFKKMTMTPKEYYADIESNRVDELVAKVQKGTPNLENAKATLDFSLEVTEDGKDIIKGLGFDLNQITTQSKISVTGNVQRKSEQLALDLALLLGDSEVVSGKAIVDFAKEVIYANVPLIGEEWAKLSEGNGDVDIALEDYLEISWTEDLYKLVAKYVKSALNKMPEFAESDTTLTLEGIEVSCTKLEHEFTLYDLGMICKPLLEELKQDKEVEALLRKILESPTIAADAEVSVDDMLESFYDSLATTIEEIEESNQREESKEQKLFAYEVMVDSKGNVVSYRAYNEEAKFEFVLQNVEKGNKQAANVVIKANDTVEITFKGTATRSGDILKDGNYVLSYNGYLGDETVNMDLLNIKLDKLDTDKLEDNQLDIEFSVGLSKALCDEMAKEISAATFLKDANIKFDIEYSAKASKLDLLLNYSEKHLATISAKTTYTNDADIKIPESAISAEDFVAKVGDGESLVTKIFDNLKKAGLTDAGASMLQGMLEDAMEPDDSYYDEDFSYEGDYFGDFSNEGIMPIAS